MKKVFSLLDNKNWINAVFAVIILTAVISNAKEEGIVGRTKRIRRAVLATMRYHQKKF